ncbi:Putative RNA polymerase II transcriptional coactivator [Fulvia fulva]|nr:putative RNA polymerase II transcriptional coactivator [Fulvia fulva]KAK4614532.1 putative RNA polymerase II transcriptional coactivator [Fulvia fulva]WPV20782.1 Putative RNA polymerase II transcriptional coactivator [Fulvia fulva]WPV35016.1 Putative RNA polymerase II transcriptional coactivator [Fulvia fulva]
MPPKKSRKRAAEEDYESDGGFIEDAPKSKKSKATSQVVNLEKQQDDDGNDYWQISGKRRLVVSEFKGNTMINIRESYEKDGKALPGKQGVSLNIHQYKAFVELLPQIESSLGAKGIEVPRPQYGGDSSAKSVEVEDDDAAKVNVNDEEEAEEEPVKPSKSKLDKFKLKPNHEATSDEDDG